MRPALTDFGVNLLRLPPGTWSSQRHWHTAEDEFVYVLEGEVVLVTDAGEETLRAGDCAGFKAGVKDGHHLQNRSQTDVVVLEVGSRKAEDDRRISGHRHALSRRTGSRARTARPIREASLRPNVQVTVRVRTAPKRALPRKCGTRQKSSAPRRTRCPLTW